MVIIIRIWHGLSKTHFSFHLYHMLECAHKTNDIVAHMHSTHVHTICLHNNLHKQTCILVMHTSDLVHMHVAEESEAF